jgi:recombinational DNA repair ATPase RecF
MELKKNIIELTALFNFSSTGIKVQQPEIVIVGGQSDGKSSLVEAIVGFKFNFIAVGRSH